MNKDFHRLSGGTRVLPRGLLARHQALIGACVCLTIAIIIGLLLHFHYQTGPYTIPLGFLAIFIGYFYTAQVILLYQLVHAGRGEAEMELSIKEYLALTRVVAAGGELMLTPAIT